MKPERWQQIERLYYAALERRPEERSTFLESACAGDESMRREVASLLAAGERIGDFMEPQEIIAAKVQAAAPQASLIGRTLGNYQVLELLGQGGMGEVYKARDTRLNRFVAIKILSEHVSNDSQLKARFSREAQALAGLSHPHICPVFDVGQEDGIDYLVMEFLEGQTLARRLEKGALPLQEALEIAIQIADALDKAHRRGIVHRDVKPSNLMLTKSGVKLLDFGLAKLRPSEEALALSAPPTRAAVTAQGVILGTLQYMSPEQLEGKPADARSDIFSFGAVLYEMTTGKKAFEGTSPASLIAAILEREPASLSTVQAAAPPVLARIVKKCLAKSPDARWQTALDLLDELKWIAEGGTQTALPPPAGARRRIQETVAWLLLGVALLVIALLGFNLSREPQGNEQHATRFAIQPPPGKTLAPGPAAPRYAISPNGRYLAFTVGDEAGRNYLWVRPLDSLTAEMVPASEGAGYPFWSPDSRSIGFFTEGKLKRVELSGGPPQTLCETSTLADGASWGRAGVILFATSRLGSKHDPSGILKVDAVGGQPVTVTKLDKTRQESAHTWPYFLPDGKHFLYLALSSVPENNALFVGSLESPQVKHVLQTDMRALYAEPGYLLYVRSGALVAQPFDLGSLKLRGEAGILAEQVASEPRNGRVAAAVSDTGVLVYRTGAPTGALKNELRWFDRSSGRPMGSVGKPDLYVGLALSPDAKRLVVELVNPSKGTDLWQFDLLRNTSTRLTFGPATGDNSNAVWSPDGASIVFSSGPSARRPLGGQMLLRKRFGFGADESLLKSDVAKTPTDWSMDGRYILFTSVDPNTNSDLWVLPLSGDRKPEQFLRTNFEEQDGQFSPDGKWIAYATDESGRFEVYVQPFPPTGAKWKVSTDGGHQPKWRSDGKEIYYRNGQRMMVVEVKATRSLELGIPRTLFQTPMPLPAFGIRYDVTPDGQRFLVSTTVEEDTNVPINVILNWPAALKR